MDKKVGAPKKASRRPERAQRKLLLRRKKLLKTSRVVHLKRGRPLLVSVEPVVAGAQLGAVLSLKL